MTPHIANTLAKLSPKEARSLLLELGAFAALRAFDRDCAQQYAAELLSQRCTRALTRDRLVHRFGISERSAYRLIDAAIQNRAKSGHGLANHRSTLNIPNN